MPILLRHLPHIMHAHFFLSIPTDVPCADRTLGFGRTTVLRETPPSLYPSFPPSSLTQSRVEFLLSVLLVDRFPRFSEKVGLCGPIWRPFAIAASGDPVDVTGSFCSRTTPPKLKRAASSPLLRLSLQSNTPQHTSPTPTEQKTTRNYGRSRQLEREGRPVRSHRRRQHGRRTSPPPIATPPPFAWSRWLTFDSP